MPTPPQSGAAADSAARCWAIIESTAPKTGRGTEEHADAVLEALAKLPAAEIVAFDRFLHERLYDAYRWDLWAVAYIAMGGCGDDAFEYFRLWVVAQGRAYYEAAMKDPVRAADAVKPGDEPECESLLYAAAEAHESVAGSPLPPPAVRAPKEPSGEPWEEETVARLYPDLAKRFGLTR
jgi:hypothetical protein